MMIMMMMIVKINNNRNQPIEMFEDQHEQQLKKRLVNFNSLTSWQFSIQNNSDFIR